MSEFPQVDLSAFLQPADESMPIQDPALVLDETWLLASASG